MIFKLFLIVYIVYDFVQYRVSPFYLYTCKICLSISIVYANRFTYTTTTVLTHAAWTGNLTGTSPSCTASVWWFADTHTPANTCCVRSSPTRATGVQVSSGLSVGLVLLFVLMWYLFDCVYSCWLYSHISVRNIRELYVMHDWIIDQMK